MKREDQAVLVDQRKDCNTRTITYVLVMVNNSKDGQRVNRVELWYDPGSFKDLKISVTLAMKSNQKIGQVLMQRDGGQTRKSARRTQRSLQRRSLAQSFFLLPQYLHPVEKCRNYKSFGGETKLVR